MTQNISKTQKLAIIMFVSGLSIGLFVAILTFVIQRSIYDGSTNSSTDTNNQNANIIQSEDLFPLINMSSSFSASVSEIVSDKELIVKLNDKKIKVILDENTKIVKQSMKTADQQRIDLDNYNKKRQENPNTPISPELPFVELEVPFGKIQIDQSIQVISDENVIGKSEVKSSRIIVNN